MQNEYLLAQNLQLARDEWTGLWRWNAPTVRTAIDVLEHQVQNVRFRLLDRDMLALALLKLPGQGLRKPGRTRLQDTAVDLPRAVLAADGRVGELAAANEPRSEAAVSV